MKSRSSGIALLAFATRGVASLLLFGCSGQPTENSPTTAAPQQATAHADAEVAASKAEVERLKKGVAGQAHAVPATPAAPWLKGTIDEKFVQIERHLRGLDQSMAEIGYRYGELLMAGKTGNWEYAQYQTEKIDLSLRLAVERRPKRAKSSEPFLNESLPPVMEAIRAKNPERLDVALKGLHTGCLQCHRAENVLYMGQLFATIQPTPPATANAIQEYKKKLTPDYLRSANRSKGRLVFSKHCANCHRLFGEGIDNGPDLTGLQRSNLDYLLTTIVDPNAMIGNDYQAVIVLTTKGRAITGLVKQEDQKTLTMQAATEKVIIPREEIEQRSVSKVSFMPEGILKTLSDEELRDLIGYLQGPDQVPPPPGKPDRDSKQPQPRTVLLEPGELQKKLKEPAAPWLKGTTDEKFAQIERHLRGLDQAMAEIGYRYGELLLSGKTRNWEYAQYQAEKIDLSLRLAIERRPKRAKSSEPFLNESLPEVMRAIKAKDGNKLDVALEKLHAGCVQCHKAEKVLYFKESVDRIKERSK